MKKLDGDRNENSDFKEYFLSLWQKRRKIIIAQKNFQRKQKGLTRLE